MPCPPFPQDFCRCFPWPRGARSRSTRRARSAWRSRAWLDAGRNRSGRGAPGSNALFRRPQPMDVSAHQRSCRKFNSAFTKVQLRDDTELSAAWPSPDCPGLVQIRVIKLSASAPLNIRWSRKRATEDSAMRRSRRGMACAVLSGLHARRPAADASPATAAVGSCAKCPPVP